MLRFTSFYLSRLALLTLAGAWLLSGLSGCEVEVAGSSYFCGPERFCPPNLACDERSQTCVLPELADRFECPEGFDASEPDDTSAELGDARVLSCGSVSVYEGCMQDIDDVDLQRVTLPGNCVASNPRLEVTLRYPAALVPVLVELVDEDGQVVATGEECTPAGDKSGRFSSCFEYPVSEVTVHVRVRTDPDAPNCGGDCHFNEYSVTVAVPLS